MATNIIWLTAGRANNAAKFVALLIQRRVRERKKREAFVIRICH